MEIRKRISALLLCATLGWLSIGCTETMIAPDEPDDFSNAEREEREELLEIYRPRYKKVGIENVENIPTWKTVKNAYRKKMKTDHPDKHQNSDGANKISQEINEAKDILKNFYDLIEHLNLEADSVSIRVIQEAYEKQKPKLTQVSGIDDVRDETRKMYENFCKHLKGD